MLKSALFSSCQILGLARKSHERSLDDPAETVVTIILSYSALEGFLNEFVEIVSSHADSANDTLEEFSSIMGEFDSGHFSLILKIKMANFILSGQRLDTGRLPFQDLDLLIRLRNKLVHRRPSLLIPIEHVAGGEQKLFEQLNARANLDYKANGLVHPTVADAARDPKVGRWSYNTALSVIRHLSAMSPQSTKPIIQMLAGNVSDIDA